MHELSDPLQIHIKYETYDQHGICFEAKELTDYNHETLVGIFNNFVFVIRKE